MCSDEKGEDLEFSEELHVCGFLNISDVCSPPYTSRHLVLPTNPTTVGKVDVLCMSKQNNFPLICSFNFEIEIRNPNVDCTSNTKTLFLKEEKMERFFST